MGRRILILLSLVLATTQFSGIKIRSPGGGSIRRETKQGEYPAIWVMTGPDGTVIEKQIQDRPDPTHKPKPDPKVTTPPGVLTYIPATPSGAIADKTILIEGSQHFKKPSPNSGTVNPNALTVTVRRDPLVFAVALDSKEPDSPHFDVLRLDLTGKGDFKSAYVIERDMTVLHPPKREFAYRFAERPLDVKLGERQMSTAFICVYTEREPLGDQKPYRHIWLSLGTCAQGACLFGEEVYNVRMWDANCNLRVTDIAKPFSVANGLADLEFADTAVVDIGNSNFDHVAYGPYGHPILVDNHLYEVTVSEDGTTVTAKPYTGKTGMVRINHPSWRAWLVGNESMLVLYGGPEPVPIPPGRYIIHRYEEWESAKWKKPRAMLQLGELRPRIRQEGGIPIAAGQTVDIVVGSPIIANLNSRQQGDTVYFEVAYTDCSGRQQPFVKDPRKPYWNMSVIIKISDAAGKPVAQLKAGWRGNTPVAKWQVPDGLEGTLTASIEFDAGSFPVEARKTTFVLGGGSAPALIPERRTPVRDQKKATPRETPASTKPAPTGAKATETSDTPDQTGREPEKQRQERLAKNQLQLAELFERNGNLEAARREYRKIVDTYPDTEFAKTAREKLAALDAKEKAKRQ